MKNQGNGGYREKKLLQMTGIGKRNKHCFSNKDQAINEKTLDKPGFSSVVRAGLEPATHGFSVRCSTN